MTRQEVELKILLAAYDMMGAEVFHPKLDAKLRDDYGFDDLDMIELCRRIETEFHLKNLNDDLDGVETLRDCVDALMKLILAEEAPTPSLCETCWRLHRPDQSCRDAITFLEGPTSGFVKTPESLLRDILFNPDTSLENLGKDGWTIVSNGFRIYFEYTDGSRAYLPYWVLELCEKSRAHEKSRVRDQIFQALGVPEKCPPTQNSCCSEGKCS